ncbi:MAG: DUF374 domain-containing protein, partial [Candidatus Dadabacteria bacterium]
IKELSVYPLGLFVGVILWLLSLMVRVRVYFEEEEFSFSSKEGWSKGSFIYLLWHNQQVLGALGVVKMLRRKERNCLSVLISRHRDGRLIAVAIRVLGLFSVAGSSTRGGVKSLLRMYREILREGRSIVITPDGPRGPIYQVKEGALYLAAKTGTAIVPLGYAVSKFWRLKSWDELVVPKPFSEISVCIGKPIFLKEEGQGKYGEAVAKKLNFLTSKAKSLL